MTCFTVMQACTYRLQQDVNSGDPAAAKVGLCNAEHAVQGCLKRSQILETVNLKGVTSTQLIL